MSNQQSQPAASDRDGVPVSQGCLPKFSRRGFLEGAVLVAGTGVLPRLPASIRIRIPAAMGYRAGRPSTVASKRPIWSSGTLSATPTFPVPRIGP